MAVTYSVKDLYVESSSWYTTRPIFIAGILWIDSEEVRLYDWEYDSSVPIADPIACTLLRAAILPACEYLGEALMQAFVQAGVSGPELHQAYWLSFYEHQKHTGIEGEQTISFRSVPPEHDLR